MTASCVLCGTPFNSLPDLGIADANLRAQKEFAEIGRLAGEHIRQHHRKTAQTVFTDPDLMGPLPIPAMIGAVGMCAQNAAVNAYLKCDDAKFQEFSEKLVALVTKAMEPVTVAPAISLV